MKLEVKGLKKNFGEQEILHGISFSVESGSALGLLGRNGAGKTTTIRILMDVFKGNGGSVLMDGKPFRPREYQIGYLPEERGLYPKKTVSEQLIYLGMLRGLSAKAAKDSMKKWIERMGVSEYENRKLETLSKGNQQKVQLAQTLICDPAVIILDEPFSGLDPVNSQILKDVIKEQIQAGKLVIFSSHQMSYVEEFCEEIAILNHGQIVLSGDLKEIKREFGRDRLVMSSLDEEAPDLARRLNDTFSDLLEVEKIQKDRVIIKKKQPENKPAILKRLLEQDVDLEYFGLYEPSLNDIFVEKAGDEA
ncbi:MAG: ATP-binding cassette domain-containing protein [Eubacteriales bacterium]|nr:ATP-binding cassette domain-containing protein [Eubacteriales bacterium]